VIDGTTKACYSNHVNVKRTVWNIRNEEESNKCEEERGIQKGNKRNISTKERTEKRKRNIEGKILKTEERNQKK